MFLGVVELASAAANGLHRNRPPWCPCAGWSWTTTFTFEVVGAGKTNLCLVYHQAHRAPGARLVEPFEA